MEAAALSAGQPARSPAKHPIVYRAREYDPIDVPLSDLLNAKGRLRLNPDVESKGYFTIQLTKGAVRLQARGYVGLIPLNDRVIIDVKPRVPVANLGHLLRVSGYVPSSLGAERPYATEQAWNESLVDLFAGWLAAKVDVIASEGLLLLYEQHEEATSFPRGRVLAGATLTQMRPRGIRHQAVSSWFARTTDSPANRCLKYAIWFIAGRLAILGSRTASRRQLLQRLGALYELFSSVPLDHSLSFLSDPLVTGARETPSLRRYYRPALDLALAIVRRYAVDVEVAGRGVDLPSLVLNMDSIFEGYLRNTLQGGAGRAGGGVDVLDGNAAGKKPLFDEPPSESATPDIVFRAAGHRWPLLIEVKNVPVNGNSSRGAIEQAVTYAAAYRCNRVVLAHPRARHQGGSGLRLQGRIGGLKVYQYVFDLGATDLLAEELKFADSMFDLCNTDLG
ncbi:MAG: McrC family protein [Actinomycetota bacterium]|nr:McrC family protein [Actinomycetota bacterium]